MSLVLRYNDKEARATISRLKDINYSQFFKTLGVEYQDWIDKNFRSQGQGIGHPGWKRLSPNTKAARRAKGTQGKILQVSGDLKRSFTARHRASFVEVGSAKKLAVWHHFGTKPYTIRPKKKKRLSFITVDGRVTARVVHHPGLPARPLIPNKRVGEKIAVKLFNAFMERQIGRR